MNPYDYRLARERMEDLRNLASTRRDDDDSADGRRRETLLDSVRRRAVRLTWRDAGFRIRPAFGR